MSTLAIVFLVLSILIVWGGLSASILYLRSHPERADYPPGGDEHYTPR
ncbi:methionine/alanine import family NSS transporter small subunit [Salinibacterium sp. SYSU T00001]|nr:methionine/alanine import family NSS transporter small subunit [Salinibacterium sedimenticola]MCW4384535.1 methionine/alanine import family NSS transporter small subunit [Salinibacterium sedimenticola]